VKRNSTIHREHLTYKDERKPEKDILPQAAQIRVTPSIHPSQKKVLNKTERYEKKGSLFLHLHLEGGKGKEK
jgi:hypothetical protein